MVERRIVEDDAHAPLLAELEQKAEHVGLVEIVGEHVEAQRCVLEHLVQNPEHLFTGREAQPFVLLLVGEVLAARIDARLLRGIEDQVGLVDRLDGRLRPEMMDERLRLHVTAGESELQALGLEAIHHDRDRRAELLIEWLQRAILVEKSRRYPLDVLSTPWLRVLYRAGHVDPTEFVDRRVDAGVRRLLGVLRVAPPLPQLNLIVNVLRTPPLRLPLNRIPS